MQTASYTKTLVIGLGSTGTRVCNELVKRIEWELGSLDRAPWVNFLAIETNSSQQSPLKRSGDFYTIGFRSSEYDNILRSVEQYTEQIDLEGWADLNTLRKLPDPENGAGNIRMVGRLSLLYKDNYDRLKEAVTHRVERLRSLKEDQAQTARGKLADGSNPDIVFDQGGGVRVFVVGTLCGGTCSGLAPDFGYFLRTVLGQEKIIGIFTLPHPQTLNPQAARLKKNAYSALVELNHYHLSAKGEAPPIRFPDGVTTERFAKTPPYDLPYLVMASRASDAGERELQTMVADRIFLNIFAPATDPYQYVVDAGVFDRNNQAHVFCTFGLANVEVPAQQLTEACTSRLLVRALQRWQSSPATDTESVLDRLGLTWPRLRGALLAENDTDPSGTPRDNAVEHRLRDVIHEIESAAQKSPEAARAKLEEWRARFTGEGGAAARVRSNQNRLVELTYNRLKGYASDVLPNVYEGTQPLQQVVRAGLAWLQEMGDLEERSSDDARRATEEALRALEAAKKAPLLRKKAAQSQALSQLNAALNDELDARLDELVYAALRNATVKGRVEPGLVERLQRVFKRVSDRLRALDGRVTRLIRQEDEQSERLAREVSPVVGLSIYEPSKSVDAEYRRCLLNHSGDPSGSLDEAQNLAAETVVARWDGLVDMVLPSLLTPPEEDVLLRPHDPTVEAPLPESQLDLLRREAGLPFAELARINVLERWGKMGVDQSGATKEARARSAAQVAKPFLRVDEAQVMHGAGSPLHKASLMLLPGGAADDAESFANAINSVFVPKKNSGAASPHRYRAVLLTEHYRFPLRALPDVLGQGGLQEAQCNDFPTFHTRKDVYWLGLAPQDADKLRNAEELLVLGVILNFIQLKHGFLSFTMNNAFGEPEDRQLPKDFHAAARMLAMENLDTKGRKLGGARKVLKARVNATWQKSTSSPEEASEHFVRLLIDKLDDFYALYPKPPILSWGDKEWARDRVRAYLSRSNDLFLAYQRVVTMDKDILNQLYLDAGGMGDWGGRVVEAGYYCPYDGGLIGATLQEAAQNGWRCMIDPDHRHGPDVMTSRVMA